MLVTERKILLETSFPLPDNLFATLILVRRLIDNCNRNLVSCTNLKEEIRPEENKNKSEENPQERTHQVSDERMYQESLRYDFGQNSLQ